RLPASCGAARSLCKHGLWHQSLFSNPCVVLGALAGRFGPRIGPESSYHPGPEAPDTIPPRGGAGIPVQPMRPPGEPMFTRNSTAEPKKLEPIKSNAGPNLSAPQAPQPQRRPNAAEVGAKSVIGNDLKIIGQGLKIISQGTLQVDGEIEGDVGGSEVIIGE